MLIIYLALFIQKRTWPWYLDFIHGEGLNAIINKASVFNIHMKKWARELEYSSECNEGKHCLRTTMIKWKGMMFLIKTIYWQSVTGIANSIHNKISMHIQIGSIYEYVTFHLEIILRSYQCQVFSINTLWMSLWQTQDVWFNHWWESVKSLGKE